MKILGRAHIRAGHLEDGIAGGMVGLCFPGDGQSCCDAAVTKPEVQKIQLLS